MSNKIYHWQISFIQLLKIPGRVYLARMHYNHDRFFSEKIKEMKAKGIKMLANSELLKKKHIIFFILLTNLLIMTFLI